MSVVNGVPGQDTGADGGGHGVHHEDALPPLSGDTGALIGAGQLVGDGQHHGAVPGSLHLIEQLGESVGDGWLVVGSTSDSTSRS